jgi:hypothetical protein
MRPNDKLFWRGDLSGLGSAGVSPVGFGVSPKQSFQKNPRWRDAIANARDARATQASARGA